jgi:hypothetical protein
METVEAVITIAGMLLGFATVWTLGYLKGRYDAGRSIAKRFDLRPRAE